MSFKTKKKTIVTRDLLKSRELRNLVIKFLDSLEFKVSQRIGQRLNIYLNEIITCLTKLKLDIH